MTRNQPYDMFEQEIEIAAGLSAEQWRLDIPAKYACYLILNDENAPLQLAITGNLRQAVINHFQTQTPNTEIDEQSEQSKTAQMYAQVMPDHSVTVKYTLTCNPFESELMYNRCAGEVAKQDQRRFLKLRKVYWVTINPEAQPVTWRTKSSKQLEGDNEMIFGPFVSQNHADKLIECLQDVFDLCRYPDELAKAPNGKACVYEEMNKCPAPCDGRISLEAYQCQIDDSIALMQGSVDQWVEMFEQEMQQAAGELQFEVAGRLKQKIERAATLKHPVYRKALQFEDVRLLTRQPGNTGAKQRVLLITPHSQHVLGEYQMKDIATQAELIHELMAKVLREAGLAKILPPVQAFDIALYHYLNDKHQHKNWLRVDSMKSAEEIRQWLDMD